MVVAVIMNLMNLSRLAEENPRRKLPEETVMRMEAVERNGEERRREAREDQRREEAVMMKTAITRNPRLRPGSKIPAPERVKEDT